MNPPKSVDKSHLQNGRLLNQAQIKIVKDYFKNNPHETLYSGNDIPFPVIKTEQDTLLALFVQPEHLLVPPENLDQLKKKIKTDKSTNPNGIYPLGIGRDGVVVAAQSLEDDSWCAAKFETFPEEFIKERTDACAMAQEALKTQPGVFKGSAKIKSHATIPRHAAIMTAMKLGPGKDLNEAMVNEKGVNKLTLSQKLDIGIKVVLATAKLPKNNIVHRDFKPNNIMASPESGEVMLIDFDGARKLKNGEFKETIATAFPGTQGYMAPELSTGAFGVDKQVHSENSMVFSLGISLAEIFTKNNLRDNDANWRSHYDTFPLPDDKSFRAILGCFSDVLSDKPEIISKRNIIEIEMSSIVRKLIHLDPNQRINCALAAKELKIIKEYHDLLSKNNISLENIKNAKSLLEHMAQIKKEYPNLKDSIGDLEKKLNKYHHAEAIYKRSLFKKRLQNYINGLDAKELPASEHKKKMQTLQKQLMALNKNSHHFPIKFNNIMNKIYAEKSLYEIDLAYIQLSKNVIAIRDLIGNEACINADKIILEIEKLQLEKPMTHDKISKLYDKIDELKESIKTIRRNSSPEIQQKSLGVLQQIAQLEKKLESAHQLHALSPREQRHVASKERKSFSHNVKRLIKSSISSLQKTKNELDISTPLTISNPTYVPPAQQENSPFTKPRPLPQPVAQTTPTSIHKDSGRPLPNPLLRELNKATSKVTTALASQQTEPSLAQVRSRPLPPPPVKVGPSSNENQPPVPLAGSSRNATDNFLAKLNRKLQTRNQGTAPNEQTLSSQVQPTSQNRHPSNKR